MRFRLLTILAFVFASDGVQAKEPRAKPAQHAGQMIVLGFAGDLGFSGNKQPLTAEGAIRHGDVIPWAELTGGVRGILAADANFANLETVISERTDLVADERSFTFQSTSAGLRHIVSIGVDVLSVANNHSADFGADGILETLKYLKETPGLKGFAGLGVGAERYEPSSFKVNDTTIAFGAIGIGFNPGGPRDPGQPLYRSDSELRRVTEGLAAMPAELRVLSVHYGQELSSFPQAKDIVRLQRPVDEGLVDVVFGHHSHVPAGVALRNGRPIFFGLGNFLHAGTQNLDRYGTCRDFGLFAKAYYWKEKSEKPRLQAIEMIPLSNTNRITAVFPPEVSASRIAVLNAFNTSVVEKPEDALLFQATETGSGLFCMPASQISDAGLKQRCHAPAAYPQPSLKEFETIISDCQQSEPPPPEQ